MKTSGLDTLAEQLLKAAKSGIDNGEPISFKERLAAFKELREHEKWRKEQNPENPAGGINDFKEAINGANSIGARSFADKSPAGNKESRNALEALSNGRKSSEDNPIPETVPSDNAVYSNGTGALKLAVPVINRSIPARSNSDSGANNV